MFCSMKELTYLKICGNRPVFSAVLFHLSPNISLYFLDRTSLRLQLQPETVKILNELAKALLRICCWFGPFSQGEKEIKGTVFL